MFCHNGKTYVELQMEEMFGRFYKKVWPLSPRKEANFTGKTPGNYKKVWPRYGKAPY
jgi:hypothetical protein